MSYFVTVKEAAEFLRIDQNMVRGLLNRGWLRGEKVERVWRVHIESLQDFYSGVSQPIEWVSDPTTEIMLARNQRCPVCAGPFLPVSGRSALAQEFVECPDCHLSLHETVLRHERDLSPQVAAHGQSLLQIENEGICARSLLLRRRLALRRARE